MGGAWEGLRRTETNRRQSQAIATNSPRGALSRSVRRVSAMKRHTKCRTHVQREARRVLLEITRAQRCLARCLARVDEVKATEAEVRKIRQQLDLVGRMIEAFNAAEADPELSAAMQLVVRLTAFEEVPSIRPDHRDRA